MFKNKILINTLIGLLVLVGLYFGYSYFFGAEEEPVGVQPVNVTSFGLQPGQTVSASDGASEFVALLDALDKVDLQSDIFNNPIFARELQDFTTPLPARPQGRSNPFAPASGGVNQ